MKRFFLLFAPFVLITSILSGCGSEVQVTKSEVRPVRTLIVDPKPIDDDREAIGEIRPRYETDLGFRVAGKLVTRLVDVGGKVKKGDLLARLDEKDFKTTIRSVRADVASVEAILAEARAAERRKKSLLAKRITSRATYDTALRTLRTSRAKLASAKAALVLARDQLGYTKLHAEYDGIVTSVGAEPGQVVATGQMIVKLAKPKDKDAVFNIAESAFRDHKPGDKPKIDVNLLSNPNIKAKGVAREISPVADPVTRTYQVKVTLKNPPQKMMFGTSVLGRLRGTTAPVVVLPGSALFDKDNKPAVWLYDSKTSQVYLKPITLSRYGSKNIIVNKGLVAGDIVVTAGVNRLREGQKVTLLPRAVR